MNPPKKVNIGTEGLIYCYQHNRPAIALLSLALNNVPNYNFSPTIIYIKDEARAFRHNASLGLCYECVKDSWNSWKRTDFAFIYQQATIPGTHYVAEVGMKLDHTINRAHFPKWTRIQVGVYPLGFMSEKILRLDAYPESIGRMAPWELVEYLDDSHLVRFTDS